MLLLLFLFGLALGAESPTAKVEVNLQVGNCPTFWYSFNGRCYKYVSSHLNWADAELHCVSEGANLVSIHSQEEQTFVKDLVKNFDPNEGWTWIGLSDTHKEGSWMWSDGSAVDFTFWAPQEPNNQGGNENCAHLNFGSDFKWNDRPCDSTYTSVCEKHIACT
uniref:lactose-binding lectin l-2-like n=1 Tax=Scatophagus argus TaxID=75038 RepID=UPI001ED85511|nr:lactose-binding lectin l-2-like [Scatophagus argus]